MAALSSIAVCCLLRTGRSSPVQGSTVQPLWQTPRAVRTAKFEDAAVPTPGLPQDNYRQLVSTVLGMDGDQLAYSLWNVTVASKDAARAACNKFKLAAADHPQGDCQFEYECDDYDQNRFPAILVSVTCHYSLCQLNSENFSSSQIVKQCITARRRTAVLVNERPETNNYAGPDGGTGAGDGSGEVSQSPRASASRTPARGNWQRQEVVVNSACICRA